MAQIRNPFTPRFVPDKFDKNQFTATAWYHIDKHWKNKEEWLSYEKFRHLDDPLAKQCRQNVFEDVLSTIKNDRLLNGDYSIVPAESALPKQHEKFIKDGKLNLGDAIIDGLKSAQSRINRQGEEVGGPKREPINIVRRQEAANWIWSNLDEGFAGFKAVFPEPDFDTAWWQKTRGEGLAKKQWAPEQAPTSINTPPENSDMSMREIVFDPRVKEPVRKATKWLFTLGSADKIRGLTHTAYADKSKHKIESHQFMKARQLALRHLAGEGDKRSTTAAAPSPRPASSASQAAAPAAPAAPVPRVTRATKNHSPYAGRTATVVLASVSTAVVNSIPPDNIRKFVIEILNQLTPDQPNPEIVFMTDPPKMEIRAQVQL